MTWSYDSLTCYSQQTGQVAEMTKRYSPSQTDVIFVVMDALLRIYEDDLIATRNVTAVLYPYAFHPSCPNQPTANWRDHEVRVCSIPAKQKMRMRMMQSRVATMTASI